MKSTKRRMSREYKKRNSKKIVRRMSCNKTRQKKAKVTRKLLKMNPNIPQTKMLLMIDDCLIF